MTSDANQPPKIIIFGTGFVAQAYLRALHYLGFRPTVISRAWLDYSDRKEVRFLLASAGYTHAINCSGFTGGSVDDVEKDEGQSILANCLTPIMLYEECRRQMLGFIHISTGCMFDGEGPFSEEDKPNFLTNVYQATKRDAEIYTPDAWIFRIRMPFSHFPHPRNWLTKLGNYSRIIDGLNSATWIDEFAIRSWQLVNKAPTGIYHACQPEPVKTLLVAARLWEAGLWEFPIEMSHGDLDEFHKTHVRRSAAVLSSKKFEDAYGAKGTPTMSAINYCIANYGKGWKYNPLAGMPNAEPLAAAHT